MEITVEQHRTATGIEAFLALGKSASITRSPKQSAVRTIKSGWRILKIVIGRRFVRLHRDLMIFASTPAVKMRGFANTVIGESRAERPANIMVHSVMGARRIDIIGEHMDV